MLERARFRLWSSVGWLNKVRRGGLWVLMTALAACQAAGWSPSAATPSPTLAPSPTASPLPAPTMAPSPTPAACDRAAPVFPLDVTIPDDTVLEPGAPFTKVWRLRNVGTCPWTRAYALVWVSGPPLAAVTRVPLAYEVPPQATVEIEVPMRAPEEGGIYQSNWMLSNAQGNSFGVGPAGDRPLWVRIRVPEPTLTVVVTPSPSSLAPLPTGVPSATPTPTAPPWLHESRAILPTTELDLDALAADGVPDLAYQQDSSGAAFLLPLNAAQLGVFGLQQPTREACAQAPQADAALPLRSLPEGMYLCYRTDAGRLGWLRFVALDPDTGELTLEIFTWAMEGEEETP